jgi:hypothetical protein
LNSPRPTLDTILNAPQSVDALAREAIEQLLIENTTVGALLAARLRSASVQAGEHQKEADEWLDIDAAAARLKKSRRWIFKHAKELTFTRRISKKTLLCSAKGIDKWLTNGARRN